MASLRFCAVIAAASAVVLASASVSAATPVRANSWMGDLMDSAAPLADRTLDQVAVPGSHDSGSYYLTKALQPGAQPDLVEDLIKFCEMLGIPAEDIITPWGEAQNVSVFEQLSGGMRYIDLRSGWNGTAWNTFHMEVGNPILTLLTDISKFLAQNPKEVVIIEVSHLDSSNGTADTAALGKMIDEQLGPYLYPAADAFTSTMAQMVAKNQRALVTVSADDIVAANPKLWPSSTIYNTYANSCNLTDMESFNDQQMDTFHGGWNPKTQGLYKMSWTLTANAGCIISGYLHGHPTSLQQLADSANVDLQRWYNSKLATKMRVPQIVIIDHFQTSPLLNVITQSNALPVPTAER